MRWFRRKTIQQHEPAIRLSEQDRKLLRQIFKAARMARLREGDLDAARECVMLEHKILYPPIEVDWAATRLGRRIAARDGRHAP